MKTRNDIFEECCRREFSFLAEFGFTLVKSEKDNYGCSMVYKNKWAALNVMKGSVQQNVMFPPDAVRLSERADHW